MTALYELTINWPALGTLPPREQLEALKKIEERINSELAAARRRVVGETVERHAAQWEWGAQSRAAAELGLTTGRVGQIYRQYRKEKTMTPYGTFIGNVADPGGAGSMRDYITTALGDHADDYDIDAIVEEYREAINERLADQGITLAGDEFYGPYPRPENAGETIADAIESVDFWEIVERHDKTA
ncbi:MAG UNVERIFIED_CONTAM: hypothetical protein LOD86_12780 [Thermobifida fusca]